MPSHEVLPVATSAQRLIEHAWHRVVAGETAATHVRGMVRDSWSRARDARVLPELARAPLALSDDALQVARARADWIPFVDRAVAQLFGSFRDGHVLTLFDADGRMLACEGDPTALDGLATINFRPGASWEEAAVGTNGPGTALATGSPVHVVGAEHFCAGFHAWHCAATPIRDQTTHAILGAVDISGPRALAHPHTLELVVALGVAVEQMLAARDVERRYLVLHRLTELSLQHPGRAVVATDRAGRVLSASGPTPVGLRPNDHPPAALRNAIAGCVASALGAAPFDARLALGADVALEATCHPVLHGAVPVGACFVLADLPVARRAAVAFPVPVPAARATPAGGVAAHRARYTFRDVVGASPALAEAMQVAAVAATNLLPVLLTGESGTGKEVVAQAIHTASARAAGPFVAVNCAALPRELVESELFGYVGGAFSGARPEGSAGRFEAAHGGTIFLDEIGELSTTAQAALLRVLQEGEVSRVGSGQRVPIDVRVIAATNRDVASALVDRTLRSDLFYRLNVLRLHLPPLRARSGDVPLLAERFAAAASADAGQPPIPLAPDLLEALQAHPWPGNVRELKNAMRRLVALAPGGRLTRADWERLAAADGPAAYPEPGGRPIPAAVARAISGDAERERTIRAIEGSATMMEAARTLGITRSTLYRRLERYGLRPQRTVGAS